MESLEGQKKQSWLPTGLLRADLLFPPSLCSRRKSSYCKKVPVIGFNTVVVVEMLGEVETQTQIQGIKGLRAQGVTKSHSVQLLAFDLDHSFIKMFQVLPLSPCIPACHT